MKRIENRHYCIRCGKWFRSSGGNVKYCEECRPIVIKEKARERYHVLHNWKKDNPRSEEERQRLYDSIVEVQATSIKIADRLEIGVTTPEKLNQCYDYLADLIAEYRLWFGTDPFSGKAITTERAVKNGQEENSGN